MSIFIKGMEMPTSCWRCMLSQLYEKPREMLVFKITHEEVLRNKIDGNCPLVEVPTPHGRLIDADVAYDEFLILMEIQGTINPCQLGTILDDAPAIIESEGE